MKVFLITLIMVILCIAGMAISIVCSKDGRFPDGEISHNEELRARGIECARAEELRRWGGRRRRREAGRSEAGGSEAGGSGIGGSGIGGSGIGGSECPPGGCEGCVFRKE